LILSVGNRFVSKLNDLREYEKRRSTPLDLFKVYVGGSGMSYFGNVQ